MAITNNVADNEKLKFKESSVTGQPGIVVINPDGTSVGGGENTATATLSNVSGSASSASLLASNTNRKSALFFNDSSAVLYLKFGTTASTTSYTVQLAANQYYEVPQPVYSGAIDGIWASATGAVRITEIT